MAAVRGTKNEGAASVQVVQAHAVVALLVVVVPIEVCTLAGVLRRQFVQLLYGVARVGVVHVVAYGPDVASCGGSAVVDGQGIGVLVHGPERGAHVAAVLGEDLDAVTAALHEVKFRGLGFVLKELVAVVGIDELAGAHVFDGVEHRVGCRGSQHERLGQSRVFPVASVGSHAIFAFARVAARVTRAAARVARGVGADAGAVLVVDVEELIARAADRVGAHQSRAIRAHVEVDVRGSLAGDVDGAVWIFVEDPDAGVVRHARGQLQAFGRKFALVVGQSFVFVDDVFLALGILDGISLAARLEYPVAVGTQFGSIGVVVDEGRSTMLRSQRHVSAFPEVAHKVVLRAILDRDFGTQGARKEQTADDGQ